MAHPPQGAPRSDPEAGGDDEPEDSRLIEFSQEMLTRFATIHAGRLSMIFMAKEEYEDMKERYGDMFYD